jgi:pimeloyl-ACP methyl ester carboxylesterase
VAVTRAGTRSPRSGEGFVVPLGLRFDYATEVARLGRLLDALDCPAVNLAGHDYGGFLALGFAQDHPGRVRRLALLNTRAHATFTPR